MSPLENVTGSRHCAYCRDDGLVVVNERADGAEEMGPCPHCERGHLLEFPEGKPGPWGQAGYWKGRDAGHLRPVLTTRTGTLREQREQVKQLIQTTTLGGSDEHTADVDF